MKRETWRLAVDGGGTRCRFALQTSETRHSVMLGAANVTSDFDGAVSTLRAGLARLAELARVNVEALAGVPAHLGLAGVMDPQDADRVREALGLSCATIADDRPAAVRGAIGHADGLVAGLGTGSYFARQRDAQIRLVGGWGPRLGDEASGFWLGRQALAATLSVVDGIGPESALTSDILLRFEGSPRRIVRFAAERPAHEIAALAPEVVNAAIKGDPVGRDLMTRGAAHIAAMIHRLGYRIGDRVVLIGGVGNAYAGYLPADIAAGLAEPKSSALEGALALAGRAAASRHSRV
jgi:glucosamine kinase